jgi:hypothetical protein
MLRSLGACPDGVRTMHGRAAFYKKVLKISLLRLLPRTRQSPFVTRL